MTRRVSVGGGGGEPCCRQSDSLISSVVDRVESLEESLTKNEVQSGSTIAASVTNNQINVIGRSINHFFKATRPDLSIGSKFEFNLWRKEEILFHTASDQSMKEYIRRKR